MSVKETHCSLFYKSLGKIGSSLGLRCDVASWRRAAFVLLTLLTSSVKCKRGADLTQEGNWEGMGEKWEVSVLLM